MKPLHVMLVFGLAVLPQVAAAERCRQIVVAPDEKLAGNTLRLSLVHDGRAFMSGEGEAAARLRAGASVDLCFESSTDGYVSLWSHDADNNAPVRILPNEYIDAEDDELGFAVEAGMERCFSELSAGRGISLTVQPPYGRRRCTCTFPRPGTARLHLGLPVDREQVLQIGIAMRPGGAPECTGQPRQALRLGNTEIRGGGMKKTLNAACAAATLAGLLAQATQAQQTFHCETTEGRTQARIVGGR